MPLNRSKRARTLSQKAAQAKAQSPKPTKENKEPDTTDPKRLESPLKKQRSAPATPIKTDRKKVAHFDKKPYLEDCFDSPAHPEASTAFLFGLEDLDGVSSPTPDSDGNSVLTDFDLGEMIEELNTYEPGSA